MFGGRTVNKNIVINILWHMVIVYGSVIIFYFLRVK